MALDEKIEGISKISGEIQELLQMQLLDAKARNIGRLIRAAEREIESEMRYQARQASQIAEMRKELEI